MTQQNATKPALAVGFVKNNAHTPFIHLVQQTLHDADIDPSIHYFDSEEAAFQSVIEGTLAVYACPLHRVATTLPLGLVIAALSERKSANNCLVIKNTEGGTVHKILALSDINCALMQFLNPDCVVQKANLTPFESLEILNSGAYDAVIVSQEEAYSLLGESNLFQIQTFSVRELIPSAGQGVACFVVAEDDLTTRRLLKQVHHSAVSAVTNIERMIQKTLKNHEISAYCERDRMGNYHLWAAAWVNGTLQKTRLSQSTSFGMAEKACQLLLSA